MTDALPQPQESQALPQRSMPDYGDLVDGDDDKDTKPQIAVKEVKGEPGESGTLGPSGPKRPEAIYVSGVERLNRTHIAEVFESKNLPDFIRVDWISDSEVIVVFDTDEEAAAVLRSAMEGFRDVDDKAPPGPGLWRAMRGMLDFRQATEGDQPAFGFRRQHRSGRQVRDFRMWAALTEMDKKILDREQEVEERRKRPAPPRDDLDNEEAPPRKRIKREDDDSIDLLEKMAHQDKKLLIKQEEKGELDPLPEVPPEAKEEEEDYWEQDSWGADQRWRRGRDRDQGWWHDDRAGWHDGSDGKNSQRRDSGNGKKGKGRGKDTSNALSGGVDATAEELERRAKRNQRFCSKSAAESNKASEAKQEV